MCLFVCVCAVAELLLLNWRCCVLACVYPPQRTHSLAHSFTRTLSHSRATHSFIHTHTLTFTHTHKHTQTHTKSLSPTHSYVHIRTGGRCSGSRRESCWGCWGGRGGYGCAGDGSEIRHCSTCWPKDWLNRTRMRERERELLGVLAKELVDENENGREREIRILQRCWLDWCDQYDMLNDFIYLHTRTHICLLLLRSIRVRLYACMPTHICVRIFICNYSNQCHTLYIHVNTYAHIRHYCEQRDTLYD